jgi:hypothetical protein
MAVAVVRSAAILRWLLYFLFLARGDPHHLHGIADHAGEASLRVAP